MFGRIGFSALSLLIWTQSAWAMTIDEAVGKGGGGKTVIVSYDGRNLLLADPETRTAKEFPVAVAKYRSKHPTGVWNIYEKRKNPTWYPPFKNEISNTPVPGGDPRNPMGSRAFYINVGLYRIHGTSAPDSIGKAASAGCIRMHNGDIESIYDEVGIGTKAVVVDDLVTTEVGASVKGWPETKAILSKIESGEIAEPTYDELLSALRVAAQYMPKAEEVTEKEYCENTATIRTEIGEVASVLERASAFHPLTAPKP